MRVLEPSQNLLYPNHRAQTLRSGLSVRQYRGSANDQKVFQGFKNNRSSPSKLECSRRYHKLTLYWLNRKDFAGPLTSQAASTGTQQTRDFSRKYYHGSYPLR